MKGVDTMAMNKTFPIRLKEIELERLKQNAATRQMSGSEYIRLLVNADYQSIKRTGKGIDEPHERGEK